MDQKVIGHTTLKDYIKIYFSAKESASFYRNNIFFPNRQNIFFKLSHTCEMIKCYSVGVYLHINTEYTRMTVLLGGEKNAKREL